MKDMKIKGTGNSRFLKSNIPAGTTIEQLIAMLNAGTFPFDFNGVNAEGIEEMGSALNKANLLPDEVAESLGLDTDADPQVKDALDTIIVKITENTAGIAAGVKFAVGNYTGIAVYSNGSITSGANKTVTIGFKPKFVMITGNPITGQHIIEIGTGVVTRRESGIAFLKDGEAQIYGYNIATSNNGELMYPSKFVFTDTGFDIISEPTAIGPNFGSSSYRFAAWG